MDQLIKYIKSLERRIEKLEDNAAPTIPIYDSTNWPETAVEGQVVIAPIV
jgi:hypothetical protein